MMAGFWMGKEEEEEEEEETTRGPGQSGSGFISLRQTMRKEMRPIRFQEK